MYFHETTSNIRLKIVDNTKIYCNNTNLLK